MMVVRRIDTREVKENLRFETTVKSLEVGQVFRLYDDVSSHT
jgi:hypothetical protein